MARGLVVDDVGFEVLLGGRRTGSRRIIEVRFVVQSPSLSEATGAHSLPAARLPSKLEGHAVADTGVRIRFAADVLRRLGEELNPSIDQGIIELVKNAFDADANMCLVELHNVEDPGGTVVVADDGRGMTLDEITDGWLVLGRSIKDPQKRTKKGRLPAGSKGLGRLAALRLGRRVTLLTRPASKSKTMYQLDIDWNSYDNVRLVEEVPLTVTSRQADNEEYRTQITIDDLRHRISRTEVRRLARALVLLADPFGDDSQGFQPRLKAPEFDDLARMVEARYFPEADYHLHAETDSDGYGHLVVMDGYDKVLYAADHKDFSGHPEAPYICPPAVFDQWIFILSGENFKLRPVSLREVQDWLRNFGGVHLYANGLRVNPYGNPGNDWLDLNLSRVRSPENRPSTNTSIGRLRVEDPQEILTQKTDRSGVIESEAFQDLRMFAIDALEYLARRRQAEADERRKRERAAARRTTERSRTGLAKAIESTGEANKPELRRAFENYERATTHEIDRLRQEVQLYRTLSTAGITAATFAHESAGSPLKIMTLNMDTIERRGSREFGDRFSSTLGQPLAGIRRAMRSIAVLGSVTLRLVEADKRRQRRVDLHAVISDVVDTFDPFFEQRDVHIDPALGPGQPFLRTSEAAVESILTNLLSNSLIAFEEIMVDRREISISTNVTGDTVLLSIADNGPGISAPSIADLWLPGYTTRVHGTGLGLAIVHDAINDMGGKIEALHSGRLGGAEFIISLPILGS
jgi:signal transduction histidine kinase